MPKPIKIPQRDDNTPKPRRSPRTWATENGRRYETTSEYLRRMRYIYGNEKNGSS